MGGQRGSDGVVPGYTDLGDLRGHPQSSMSWVCEALGGVTVWVANPGAPIGLRHPGSITLTWDGT